MSYCHIIYDCSMHSHRGRMGTRKSLDIIGLGLSVGASFAPPALAWRLGLTAIGVDAIQGDLTGMFIGYGALFKNSARTMLDLTYGIWQVIK